MKKIILTSIIIGLLALSSCKKEDNAGKIMGNTNTGKIQKESKVISKKDKIKLHIDYSINDAINDDKLFKQAQKDNNKNYCENIIKQELKLDCLNSLKLQSIENKGNIKGCKILKGIYKNRCLLFFVEKNNNLGKNNCNILKQTKIKQECLNDFYFKIKNCNKITDPQMKDDCKTKN